MSNLTSKYSIDLVINDDKTNDSIRKLKAELNNITSAQDMSQSLSATNDLIVKLDQFAKEANEVNDRANLEYVKTANPTRFRGANCFANLLRCGCQNAFSVPSRLILL